MTIRVNNLERSRFDHRSSLSDVSTAISAALLNNYSRTSHEATTAPSIKPRWSLTGSSWSFTIESSDHIFGFHVTSQALLKSVSAMLVSLWCQIYANNSPFLLGSFSIIALLFCQLHEYPHRKQTIKEPSIHLKVSQCSLSLSKAYRVE